jgi:nicotinate-nucleotide adenylyltransferase
MDEIPVGPLPIPKSAKTVLIYGGAFDPPHRAHVQLPPRARDAIGADLLLYVPAAAAPLKEGPAASNMDRIGMLEAALEGEPDIAIATLELERGGSSYTIDTLEHITSRRPNLTLRLLIGADQARQFHEWKQAREIIELAEPAVMLRPPAEEAEDLLEDMAPHWSESETASWRRRLVELPAIDASSTRARELLARSPADPELERLLTAPVRAYIRRNKLYREPA